MNEITEIIKAILASPHNLSQTEISKRTGISQPRISRWESGDVAAGANDALKLVALAREVGVFTHPAVATAMAEIKSSQTFTTVTEPAQGVAENANLDAADAVPTPEMDDHRSHSLRRTHADSPYEHTDIDRRAEEGPAHFGRRASNGHPGDAESAKGGA